MKNIVLVLLFSTSRFLAQADFTLNEIYFNNYLYFFQGDSNLIALATKQSHSATNNSYNNENFVTIFSNENGDIVREIPLSENDKSIFAFNVSHDGLSFVLVTSSSGAWYKNEGPFIIKKYLLKEGKWSWEKKWYTEEPCLKLSYDKDDNQIICVTSKSTLMINSESGSLIKKSNSISQITDSDAKYPRFELSKNGRYFAYWEAKYLTFSKDDETGFLLFGDFLWYGIKWLFYFGTIPQYVYVWDIYEDKLLAEIPIPYESNRGVPTFTEDEKELLLGPYHGKYKVFSVEGRKEITTFFQKESVYNSPNTNLSERNTIGASDYKVISNDKKYFASCFEISTIYVIDYNNGELLRKFERTSLASPSIPRLGEPYAMSFSPDNKYFAVVTKDNKINLYNTQTWELVWQTEYPQKK